LEETWKTGGYMWSMDKKSTSPLVSKEAGCDVTRGLAAGVIGDLVSSPRQFVDLILDVKGYSSNFL
jgi:hypothetical protein